MERNIKEYHESIVSEFKILQNRVRNLIGDAHWPDDGEHKEALVRRIIRSHIPEKYRVGKGFICYPKGFHLTGNRLTSNQIDVLISKKNKPTLFKEGDLVFITPDVIESIIEVKTSLNGQDIDRILKKLADEKQRIYQVIKSYCKIGLFVFNDSGPNIKIILKKVQKASKSLKERSINYISIGPNRFIRYWQDGMNQVDSPVNGPVWHSYELDNLGHSYFIFNIVVGDEAESNFNSQKLYFPVEPSKEVSRKWYIPIDGYEPKRFNNTL